MVRLHFLGAAREVTGSLILVESTGGRLLVDCGMFQGRRAGSRSRNGSVPPVAAAADAAILTHAHIDHCGSLPTLVKAGFRGLIHTTPASRDVAALMLRDSAHIQEADARYLNRRFAGDPHWEEVRPVYDEADVETTLGQMVGVPCHEAFSPLRGVRACFRDAGHILGSAHVHLTVEDDGRPVHIHFSGDLGRPGLPILRDPEAPETPVDFAVLESTYGGRTHPPFANTHDQLARIVTDTVARGGRIVVPAFALGRAQELIYALHELRVAGRIPSVPIFVDSPLATAVTGVVQQHAECFDAAARRLAGPGRALLDFPGVHYISAVEDSIALNDRTEPLLIISASGMCESGRVLHHLRRSVGDPRNSIVIVGFQAEHTLGRRLVERRRTVRILGVEREVEAQVEVLDALSAHADREGLLGFARGYGPTAQRIFLVHGEPDQQFALQRALEAEGRNVTVPARGEVVDLI